MLDVIHPASQSLIRCIAPRTSQTSAYGMNPSTERNHIMQETTRRFINDAAEVYGCDIISENGLNELGNDIALVSRSSFSDMLSGTWQIHVEPRFNTSWWYYLKQDRETLLYCGMEDCSKPFGMAAIDIIVKSSRCSECGKPMLLDDLEGLDGDRYCHECATEVRRLNEQAEQ